jgi:signal transduction histidine kinase
MEKPKIPKNEKERLQELASYDIPGVSEEEDFDFLTSMASQICGTKISLVSLVTEDKQCFISHHGLDVNETSRDVSFCAHAINSPEKAFIIEDAREDFRFFDNPLTTGDPQVVFYAGIPLINSNGFPLGTLCVIDDKPGKLNDLQLSQLQKLAKQTINLMELKRSQIELKQVNENLEQFAFTAAHDLKEPLRGINQFLKLLSKKYESKLDETAQKYIHFAVDGSRRMGNLINDLLTFAEIGVGDQSSFKIVDLNMIFEETILLQGALIEENKARVSKSELPKIWAQETGMKILFQNLISNGLKYQPAGKEQVIEVSCSHNDTNCILAFKDNGIGISEENQVKVFNLFTRLHSKSEYQGTGMGLATCKKIVEIHQGKIWVESEISKGSVFYVSLPKYIDIE